MMFPGRPPFAGKGGCKGKGGAKGPGMVDGSNGKSLEAGFNTTLQSFNNSVRNLQLSPIEIRQEFEVLMKARLELHAVNPGAIIAPQPQPSAPPMMQMGMGMGMPMGMPGAGGEEDQVNWKGLLQQHMGKWLKRVVQSGDLEYKTETADPSGATTGGYLCTLVCNCLEQQGNDEAPSFQGSLRPSKKQAEQDAAMHAFADLFPDNVPAVMSGMWGFPGGKQPPTKKRKLNQAEQEGDSKTALIRGMQALLERPLVKGDVSYTTEGPDEGQMYICTLVLAAYDNQTFIGERAKSKKDAEMSAADIACKAMEAVFVPKLQERQQMKSAKNAEKLALLKEQTKAKKEANKTAAEAVPVKTE